MRPHHNTKTKKEAGSIRLILKCKTYFLRSTEEKFVEYEVFSESWLQQSARSYSFIFTNHYAVTFFY